MDTTSSTPTPQWEQESSEGRLPRRTFRFRKHTLGPDRRPEAEPVTYEMHCTSCYAIGPVSTDGEDGTAWALRHLKEFPSHLNYREHITRSYRAEAGAWQ